MNNINPRLIAYNILLRAESGAYSSLVLDAELKKRDFNNRDKAFITALFYGVIERLITLDFVINRFAKVKLETKIRVLLRTAFYQLIYMNSVPEAAAVNETVNLAPKRAKGFINAVLRNFLRDKDDVLSDLEKSSLSIKYSCPEWLVKKWLLEYGEKNALSILETSLKRPPIFIRNNVLKNSNLPPRQELNGLIEINSDYHVQDKSSQEACELLNPLSGETLIDLCAAPGGKSFTLAQLMRNKGRVISCDIKASKLNLIRKGARRLGLDIIEVCENDAKIFNPDFPKADKILCDVPCSGTGVIRRKPEIKYKTQETFAKLPEIQLEILKTASKYLKDGGTLMYSTCALSRAENDEVAEAFLKENAGFKLIEKRTIIPSANGGDGFFMALMKKGL